MFTVTAKYGSAKVYADICEPECVQQIYEIMNHPVTEGCQVRIMADTHAGAGVPIGYTAEIKDKVIPNLVGVDIGCGVLTIPLGPVDINFKKLDKVIREHIPSGFNINPIVGKDAEPGLTIITNMKCYNNVIKHQESNILKAIGSLGGGNHFLEIDEDENGEKYLLIHTGSRHLGLDVCKYYQTKTKDYDDKSKLDNLIADLKSQGRQSEIEDAIKSYKAHSIKIPKSLRYLIGKDKDDYLNDMRLCQDYAALNRFVIAKRIIKFLFNDCQTRLSTTGTFKIKQKGKYDFTRFWFDTIHNYIGDDNIVRKGAVSAYENEDLIIPINMRDGALICQGKGNADYNFSAPHGAGRIMSRATARNNLDLLEYKDQMSGIYSTCINKSTIDESPMAYKGINSIINNIRDTVEIVKRIKPIYNFKAGDEQ